MYYTDSELNLFDFFVCFVFIQQEKQIGYCQG